jgi:hypothetical protein
MATKNAQTNGKARASGEPDVAAIRADPGGSRLDARNSRVAPETAQALCVAASAVPVRSFPLADAAFIDGGPRDVLEGMMAAQLFATHAATMACHRRAMDGRSSFDRRVEDLSQANRFSRTFGVLLTELRRYRRARQRRIPRNNPMQSKSEE